MKHLSVIHNAIDVESKWENFINLINVSVIFKSEDNNDSNIKKKYSRMGLTRFYDKLTMVIDYAEKFNYLSNDLEKIKKYLEENSNYKMERSLAVISFTNSEKSTGRHSDEHDILYVQCIGTVMWKIWEEEKEKTFILNKGDCIFVKKNIEHEVLSITPRASLSAILK
jgi:hypothetical protein